MTQLAQAFVFVFIVLLTPQWGRAAFEVKTNLFFSNLTSGDSDLYLRSHNMIYLGFSSFQIGPFYNYEPLHSYVTDQSYGLALKWGSSLYFEIGGGVYERKYEEQKGKGMMGSLTLGKTLSKIISVSLTTIYKSLQSGDLEKRDMVDLLPYIGFRFEM